jgi:hypothetical protein
LHGGHQPPRRNAITARRQRSGRRASPARHRGRAGRRTARGRRLPARRVISPSARPADCCAAIAARTRRGMKRASLRSRVWMRRLSAAPDARATTAPRAVSARTTRLRSRGQRQSGRASGQDHELLHGDLLLRTVYVYSIVRSPPRGKPDGSTTRALEGEAPAGRPLAGGSGRSVRAVDALARRGAGGPGP